MACTRTKKGGHYEAIKGILSNHAYGLMDFQTVQGRNKKKENIVKIFNPWGSFEWEGAWSDNDDKHWTKALRSKYGVNDADDGCFWMSFHDFCKYYNRIYVCHVIQNISVDISLKSEWKTSAGTAGGCSNEVTWRQNQHFSISTLSPKIKYSNFFLIVGQNNQRGKTDDISYHQIGFQIVKLKEQGPCVTQDNYKLISKTSFWNKREGNNFFLHDLSAEIIIFLF
jgi:hypothetical protein